MVYTRMFIIFPVLFNENTIIFITVDKRDIQIILLLISPRKCMLWVIITRVSAKTYVVIIITTTITIIIKSLFLKDDMFRIYANLTYGPNNRNIVDERYNRYTVKTITNVKTII